jgi:hypothetical protein
MPPAQVLDECHDAIVTLQTIAGNRGPAIRQRQVTGDMIDDVMNRYRGQDCLDELMKLMVRVDLISSVAWIRARNASRHVYPEHINGAIDVAH